MHTELRTGQIDRIYLHTNEGPQGPNAAANLAGYLHTIDAGYHVVVDDQNTIRVAPDNQVVWAEGGDNSHALSVCMIGYSATNDWSSQYSTAMIGRAAVQAATWAKQYNIPALRVAPGAPPTMTGIAQHADDRCPASQGHTDPGANFPMDGFIKIVHDIVTPPPDWHAIQLLVEWQQRCAGNPLHLGDKLYDVAILKELLNKRGVRTDPGHTYGAKVAEGVAFLKAYWRLKDRDGTVVGGSFAKTLITRP